MYRFDSPYYLNCTNMTLQQLHYMTIIRSTVALICMVVLVVMLLALCVSKAYKSFVQRMLIYLVTAAILDELFQASSLENLLRFSHQEMTCTVLGFLTNWVDNISSLHSLSIIIWTIILAFIHLNYPHYSSVSLSTCWKIVIDVSYLVLTILLPLLVMWMPLKNGNYGIAVAWCFIRAFNEDCKDVGFVDQMVAGYGIYGFIEVIGILAMAGVIIVYCRLSANYTRVKALLLQNLGLTSFVLLSFLIVCTCLAIRIHSALHNWTQPYAVWLLHGASIPLFHLIIPLGFFGSFYFNYFRNKFCKKKCNPGAQLLEEDRKTIAPTSVRQTAPSSTYFNISYTNGFTSIRDDSQATPLLTTQGEH